MESLKKRLKESVQFRLSFVLCMAVGGIAMLTGALGFISALDEAHELQDSSLQQIASLAKEGMLTPRSGNFISPPIHDEKASGIVVHFMFAGKPDNNATPQETFRVADNLTSDFHTLVINQHVYRVLIEDIHDGLRVAVAQRASVREHVAFSSAMRSLIPFFILFPVLLYLVADLVKKIFRPISRLSDEVNQQSDGLRVSLNSQDIPREIIPFIRAINRLLQRSAESVALQQRFVADAAHELRSPLTALMLQAERLETSELPAESRNRLIRLREGMKRAAYLVEQLLSLSRAQAGDDAVLPAAERVLVFNVVKQVISDLHPLAEEKLLDIGMVGESQAEVKVRPSELYTVVRNIIHNAIQYTPNEGKIDVAIINHASQVIIEIEDSGPGIPLEIRQRVFDAFYRLEGNDATGTGLGLSIVSAITTRMQGNVTLADAMHSSSGLNVRITLPAA